MLLIFALLFAIPSYGLSILLYVAWLSYLSVKRKNAAAKLSDLEKAVLYLANEYNGSSVGTAIEEISRSNILNYLVINRVAWREVGDRRDNKEFQLAIAGGKYDVYVSYEPNERGGAILRVRKSEEWRDELYGWMVELGEQPSTSKYFLHLQSRISLGSDQYATPVNPISIPIGIRNLTSLRELTLINCNITVIPMSVISSLTMLETLDLSFNQLQHLPIEVCRLPRLKRLDICESGLTYLPDEISDLAALEDLGIARNKLMLLPVSIVGLRKLKRLDMWGNNNLQLSDLQEKWFVDLIAGGAEVSMEKDRYERLRQEYPDLSMQNCFHAAV